MPSSFSHYAVEHALNVLLDIRAETTDPSTLERVNAAITATHKIVEPEIALSAAEIHHKDGITRTVWAASSGSYSDYSVDCLFETEEDAQAYIDAGHAEHVESFEMHPAGYRPNTTTVYRAFIASHLHEMEVSSEGRLDDDGSVTREFRRPVVNVSDQRAAWTAPSSPYLRGGYWNVSAYCLDREAAIKACADRAAPFQLLVD